MALIFSETFEDIAAIEANGGVHNLVEGDIVAGYSGNAVNITGSKYLKYPALNNFNFGKGAIEIVFRPNWDTRESQSGYIYLMGATWGTTQYLDLWLADFSSESYTTNMLQAYFHGVAQPVQGVPFSTEPYGIQSCRSDVRSLLELYWDLTSETDSFILFKINDRYHRWFAFPQATIQELGENKFIFVGSNTVPNGQFNGIIDSFNIYDDPADLLPVAVASFPRAKFYNPWDANEADILALFPDGDGICSPWETNATNPLDCALLDAGIYAADNVLFFKKPHLEQVYEGTVPTEAEIDDPFTWRQAQGQIERIVFNVYSRIALTNMQVDYTAFTGTPGTINKTAVDLRIVKNWWQGCDSGGSSHNAVPYWVGEVLLHDDTIALETDQTLGITKCPTLPTQDFVTSAMAAATSRQFVMQVTIPADAVPGNYVSTITLTADGGVSVTKEINLTVLPFSLRESPTKQSTWIFPEFDASIITNMSLDRWDVFEKQLTYLRLLGINCCNVMCYAPSYWGTTTISNIDTVIDYVAAAGFTELRIWGCAADSNNVNYATRYSEALVAKMESVGFLPYLYGEDEFDVGWAGLAWQVRKAKHIHSVGGLVHSSCTARANMATYQANLATYNAADYPEEGDLAGDASIDSNYYSISQRTEVTCGSPFYDRLPGIIEGFYWQTREGNTRWHRYNIGYQLWVSGLQGNAADANPPNERFYNDFEGTGAYGFIGNSVVGVGSTDYAVVPTYTALALAEGIRDSRYLATWQYWYNRIAKTFPSEAASSRATVYGILADYTDPGTGSKPDTRKSYANWQTDRDAIVDEIVTLKNLRGGGKWFSGMRPSKVSGVVPVRT